MNLIRLSTLIVVITLVTIAIYLTLGEAPEGQGFKTYKEDADEKKTKDIVINK